jgi:feruloyl esterase
MMHCRGGAGPDQFSMMGVIERWRETGAAPDAIPAYHVAANRVDMSRPLCAYPEVAVYKGSGNPNDAGNFVCRAQ